MFYMRYGKLMTPNGRIIFKVKRVLEFHYPPSFI